MKPRLLRPVLATLVTAGLVAGCSSATHGTPAASAPSGCQPTMTALPQVGTGDNQGVAFSAAGLVVGYAATSDGPVPAMWQNGTGAELPRPAGMVRGRALGVNDHGDVVGILKDEEGVPHAFYWDGKTMSFLKGLPNGQGTAVGAINASGAISGSAFDSGGHSHAVRWASYDAAPTVLDTPSAVADAIALAINDAGTVAGATGLLGQQDANHPALWAGSHIQMLAGIAGPGSVGEVLAINATGASGGDSSVTMKTNDPAFASHATVWEPSGAAHDLGTLPGDNYSQVLGLSPSGYAAGQSEIFDYTSQSPGISHAFVWSGTNVVVELPLPNMPRSTTASTAMAIDDKGTVVGSFRPAGQPSQAAVWTCALGSKAQ